MPVSPQDFALWASATGQRYPQNALERAQLTPEVFNFVRNLPKTGLPGRAGEVVDSVIYDHPTAIRHEDDNSLYTAPITPDNHVPKVAGTIGNTLTSDHYEAHLAENQEDAADTNSFARNAAKAALAAGVIAGGIAAAQSPAIRGRISEFLTQFGTPREGVVDMVAAAGDITPQTTAQNYNQEVIAPQTRVQQVVRGSDPGTPLKTADPTTTQATSVKPVTESEIITTTQNFSPKEEFIAYRPDPREMVSPEVAEARRKAATEALLQKAASRRETYQSEIPGVKAELMALRSPLLGLTEGTGELTVQAESRPLTIAPAQQNLFELTTQNLSPVADPWTGEQTVLQGTRETPLSERIQRFTSQFANTPDTDAWASRSELARSQGEADIAALAAQGLSPRGIERIRPTRPSIYEALAEVAPTDIEINPLYERTVANIGPQAEISKTASGTGIRGISRIADVPDSIDRQRQVSGPDTFVDAPIEMSADIRGSERQPPSPLGRVPMDSQGRPVPIRTISREGLRSEIDDYAIRTGKGAGLGIYGPEKGYAAGAINRETGEYTTAATRRPTEVPKFIETQERTPFGNVSRQAIQSMVETGKISSKGQLAAAQQELDSRARKIESLKLAQRVLRGEVAIPPVQGPRSPSGYGGYL